MKRTKLGQPRELRDWATQRAKGIRDVAMQKGLRFQAYLPPELALWLLNQIEQRMFIDPSEAVFVLLSEARELERHGDLRQELFKRRIQSTIEDPTPSILADKVFAEFEAARDKSKPEPALWVAKHSD